MSNEQSADVKAERQRIVAGAIAWGASNWAVRQVRAALTTVGLGEFLPRERATVKIHVVGTVEVPCEPDGTWTQTQALYALQRSVFAGTAIVEAEEVPDEAPTQEIPNDAVTAEAAIA